jgi:hypothetical protein
MSRNYSCEMNNNRVGKASSSVEMTLIKRYEHLRQQIRTISLLDMFRLANESVFYHVLQAID